MRRSWAYAGLLVMAGVVAGLWFTLTEDVDPAATDPAAYDFLLVITVVLAVTGAAAGCGLYEIVLRLRRRDRTAT